MPARKRTTAKPKAAAPEFQADGTETQYFEKKSDVKVTFNWPTIRRSIIEQVEQHLKENEDLTLDSYHFRDFEFYVDGITVEEEA